MNAELDIPRQDDEVAVCLAACASDAIYMDQLTTAPTEAILWLRDRGNEPMPQGVVNRELTELLAGWPGGKT